MKRIFLTIIIFIFLLMPINALAFQANGWQGKDYYTHVGTTADNVTFAWEMGLGTDEDFEIEIYNPERKITRHIGFTTQNEITFKVPKTGHWIGKVRVRRLLSDQTYDYGTWFESTDPDVAVVDIEVCDQDGCTTSQINRSWWCFAWIKSTGPIITNDGQFFGIIKRESK